MKTRTTVSIIGLALLFRVSGHTEPVQLQQATATFSQTSPNVHLVAESIDGVINQRGWAIYPQITNQTAVFETTTDVGFAEGTALTFTLIQNFVWPGSFPGHTLGRFRLSVTTDARDTFADGLARDGDVTATWTVLNPYSMRSANGTVFTKLPDNSILASGETPGPTDTYTISASTTLTNITGIRLEALQDASLPYNGPGRHVNGNFTLTELQLDAIELRTDLLATIGVSCVDICWRGLTNKMYQVQYSSQLNQWLNLSTPVQGNGTNCVTDSIRGSERRFYRVVDAQ